MTNSNAGAQPVNPTLSDALMLYRSLGDQLSRAIERLGGGKDDNLPDAKSHNELIRSHQKALQTVLDLEQRYNEQQEREAAGRRYLDLAAARDEVLGRLARLRSIKRS